MTDAPGWYPDPLGRRRWRWFDGTVWTSQTSTARPPSAPDLPSEDEPAWDDDELTEADLVARARSRDAAPPPEPAIEDDDDDEVDDALEAEWELEDEADWEDLEDELDDRAEAEPDLELDDPAEAEPDLGLDDPAEPDDGFAALWASEERGWDDEELQWLAAPDVPPAPAPAPPADAVPVPEPEPEPASAAPAHLAASPAGPRPPYRRRRLVLLLVAAAAIAAVVLVWSGSGGGGRRSFDREHLALTYEGNLLGTAGTTIDVVVDGEDVLQDRRAGDRRRVTLVREGTTYDCPLDASSGVCVRADAESAAAAARAALLLFLDPLSPDGTFGAAAERAEPAGERTVAGRPSECSTVSVPGRTQPYEVCRDARLGFLTSAKGRDLDLVLQQARVPRAGEVRVPDGVEVEGEPDPDA